MGSKLQLPSVPVILLLGYDKFVEMLTERERDILLYLDKEAKIPQNRNKTCVRRAQENNCEVRNFNYILDSIWHKARIYCTTYTFQRICTLYKTVNLKPTRKRCKHKLWQKKATQSGKKVFVRREAMKELTRQYEIQVMDS